MWDAATLDRWEGDGDGQKGGERVDKRWRDRTGKRDEGLGGGGGMMKTDGGGGVKEHGEGRKGERGAREEEEG